MVDNLFLNAQEFSNAMMLLVKNTLVWGRRVNGRFSNLVTDENGLVMSEKAPPQFIASTGEALQTQRLLIGSRTIAVNKYRGVHFSVGDLEYVRSFNDLMSYLVNHTRPGQEITLRVLRDAEPMDVTVTLGERP